MPNRPTPGRRPRIRQTLGFSGIIPSFDDSEVADSRPRTLETSDNMPSEDSTSSPVADPSPHTSLAPDNQNGIASTEPTTPGSTSMELVRYVPRDGNQIHNAVHNTVHNAVPMEREVLQDLPLVVPQNLPLKNFLQASLAWPESPLLPLRLRSAASGEDVSETAVGNTAIDNLMSSPHPASPHPASTLGTLLSVAGLDLRGQMNALKPIKKRVRFVEEDDEDEAASADDVPGEFEMGDVEMPEIAEGPRRSSRLSNKPPVILGILTGRKIRKDAGKKKSPKPEPSSSPNPQMNVDPQITADTNSDAETKADVEIDAEPHPKSGSSSPAPSQAPPVEPKPIVYYDSSGEPHLRQWFVENNQPRFKASRGKRYIPPTEPRESVYTPHKRIRLPDGSWEDPWVLYGSNWKNCDIEWRQDLRPTIPQQLRQEIPQQPRSFAPIDPGRWKNRSPNNGNIEVLDYSEDETDGEDNYAINEAHKFVLNEYPHVKKRKRT